MTDLKERLRAALREREEAVSYAQSYSGNFGFMISMRFQATRLGWKPSEKQVKSILRCKRHEARVGKTSTQLSNLKTSLWNGGPAGWIAVSIMLVVNVNKNNYEPMKFTRHMYGHPPARLLCGARTKLGTLCYNNALIGQERCGTHANTAQKWQAKKLEKRFQGVWISESGVSVPAIVNG